MEFTCLSFGLGPGPRMFTKLLKPLIAFLFRLRIWLVIYLDDMLVMNIDCDQLIKDKQTITNTPQNLGWVINMEKSSMNPSQRLEFLGFVVDSEHMTLELPVDKVVQIKEDCRNLLRTGKTTVRMLAKLIGRLTASVLAVLPAPLHYRQLQMQKTRALLKFKQYEAEVFLNAECKEELRWWIIHLEDWNGKAMITPGPDMLITSDASKKGWGATCSKQRTQGLWSPQEQKLHINAL